MENRMINQSYCLAQTIVSQMQMSQNQSLLTYVEFVVQKLSLTPDAIRYLLHIASIAKQVEPSKYRQFAVAVALTVGLTRDSLRPREISTLLKIPQARLDELQLKVVCELGDQLYATSATPANKIL